MKINLHLLEILLCIARERSFSKAAGKLRIQPAFGIHTSEKPGGCFGGKAVRAARPARLSDVKTVKVKEDHAQTIFDLSPPGFTRGGFVEERLQKEAYRLAVERLAIKKRRYENQSVRAKGARAWVADSRRLVLSYQSRYFIDDRPHGTPLVVLHR